MSDMKEIHDLSPAPRSTPVPVLWAMAAVVLAGSGVLVHSVHSDNAKARFQASQPVGSYALTVTPAKPLATAKQVNPQAK